MKMKKNNYHFPKNKIKFLNKLFIVTIIFFFLIGLLIYYKPALYFTDKYGWYIHFGWKHSKIGNFKKSFEYANKAIALNPERLESHEIIEMSLLFKGDSILAEQKLNTILTLIDIKNGSQLSDYYWHKGILRLRQGLRNESMIYFKKGIEADPSNFLNYWGVGVFYLANDDLDNAFKYFKQSKEYINQPIIDKSIKKKWIAGAAYAGLGFVYQKQGLYQKAEDEFKIARSLNPWVEEFIPLLIS